MDSSVIQFIVNSLLPWLIFSSAIYLCSSYITKYDNTSPNIWWFALAASFLPFIPLSFGSMNIVVSNLDYLNSSLENVQIVKQASITHASLNIADLIATALIIGYFCITSLKLVQLMTIWKNLKRLSRASELIGDLTNTEARVVISPLNHSPFVYGAAVPYIVLPKYFSLLEKDQQSILIRHELTHIANKDHISILLWRVLSTLLWINPFIKKIEWQFIRAMEHRCDRQTIHRFNINKHDYAKTLLESLKQSVQLDNNNPVAQFNSGVLCAHDYKTRLTNIVGPANQSHLNLSIKFLLTILTLFGLYAILKESEVTEKLAWQHPLENYTVSSPFQDINKIRNYKPHQGTDYIAEKGSLVLSAADGFIVIADNNSLHSNYGNTVLIQHKGGYQTLYSHLESISVNAGTWVKAGQSLGSIGDTGKATGVHLHFEVIKDNYRVDPSLVLNAEALKS